MRLGVVMAETRATLKGGGTGCRHDTPEEPLTAMFRMRRDVEKQGGTPPPHGVWRGKSQKGWAAMILSRSLPERPRRLAVARYTTPTGYARATLRHRRPGTRLPRRADPQV